MLESGSIFARSASDLTETSGLAFCALIASWPVPGPASPWLAETCSSARARQFWWMRSSGSCLSAKAMGASRQGNLSSTWTYDDPLLCSPPMKGAFKHQPSVADACRSHDGAPSRKIRAEIRPLSDARLAGNLIGRLAFAASQQFNRLRFVSSFCVSSSVIDPSRLKEAGRGLGAQNSSSRRSASMTASKVTGAARGLEEQTVHLKTGSLS